ncbi:fibronectin type III domain-containing protein [Gottfriedia acidiceleris]|uniref:fibronectin type III domain-containing protein n=1 Tax=Gottfriedia acidiceleris TaxID=371036 RepID=UPI003391BC35
MPLNEELLSKFTQNERGDLYFEDKLIVRKDITAPEPVSNLQIVSATQEKVEVSFDASVSTDVVNYKVSLAKEMDEGMDPITVDVGTQTTYTFTGVNLTDTGLKYYVSVQAYDGHDNFSDGISVWFEVQH